MNPNVEKLYAIASKEQRLIVGLMSGTSLDGLDICLCLIKGSGTETQISVLKQDTLTYGESFRNEIRSIFASRQADLAMVSAMHAKIGLAHATLLKKTLTRWQIEPNTVDLIASHGQTIFHAPRSLIKSTEFPNSTLQIGDGDHIAVHTGIITVSDFRQKHVASGGEGAPLVVYGDYLLFSPHEENRLMLNIGGISNCTLLPQGKSAIGVVATDIGPGNTLMNQYMKAHFHKSYDKDGELAAQGEINPNLLNALLAYPFFSMPFPKTTGPELFNLDYVYQAQQKSQTQSLAHEDVMATLCQLTATTIAQAVLSIGANHDPLSVYVSGGGWHNPVLLKNLRHVLDGISIENTDVLGMPSDAKEAVLFALLANECVAGQRPIAFSKESTIPASFMGKISFPD